MRAAPRRRGGLSVRAAPRRRGGLSVRAAPRRRGGLSVRAAALAWALAVAVAGCGGDGQTESVAEPPPAPRVQPDTQVEAGQRLVARAGCLACHQIGADGASGPGNNLDGIGTRRSASELRGALLDSPAPMPSYRDMPRRDRDAIVAYLSALRGDAGCADGSDCG